MKGIIFTLFLLTSVGVFSQTQTEMNIEASNAYKKSDQKLNAVYQKILSEYKDDKVFIKNLKTAQRLWIQFRDAEMKAKFPDREAGYYGSIQPLCWFNYLQELTEERTRKLNTWLQGGEEGDVYGGSVK